MASSSLSLQGVLVRFLAAFGLVIATYNPTPYNFIEWLRAHMAAGTTGPEHWFVLVVLLIGWVIFFRATWRSLGPLGVLLTAGFFGTLVWLLADRGIVTPAGKGQIIWIAELSLAALLATGLSWSHVRRRITGQVDTDDTGD
ncbi:MAG: DUF6524 family protein [Pseudomonadota bacterium]